MSSRSSLEIVMLLCLSAARPSCQAPMGNCWIRRSGVSALRTAIWPRAEGAWLSDIGRQEHARLLVEVKAALESSARTSAAKGVCRHRAVSGAGTELLGRRSGAAPRNGASRANWRPQNTRAGLVVRKSDDLCAAVRVTCEGRFSPWAPSCALWSRYGRVRSAFHSISESGFAMIALENIDTLSTNCSNQNSCWQMVCCSIRVSGRLRRISRRFGETT